ncbi:DoxX family protein [Streptomyces sp. NPDC001530]|uniref:DoxX family protein n=1 Tax=Streptomyces sp. NPDC001530 TaxID=3364582 RepID=UPI0036B4EE0E
MGSVIAPAVSHPRLPRCSRGDLWTSCESSWLEPPARYSSSPGRSRSTGCAGPCSTATTSACRPRCGGRSACWRPEAAWGFSGGLAVRPLGIAAGAGLCALMFGAVLTHLRARDPIAVVASASGVLLLASTSLVCGIAV